MSFHHPKTRSEWRIAVLAMLVLFAVAVLLGKLWYVQVARGAHYASKISGRSQVTVRIPSVRGDIRDRNGLPLVQNRASYDVDFYLPDMVRGYKDRSGGILPRVEYLAPVRGMMKKMQEADIVQIVNTAVVPRLHELELAQDYNAKRLQRHYRTNTEVPYVYLEDIKFSTIARYCEHDVGLPGVDISIRPVRQYLYGAFAGHLLGYVGMPEDLRSEPDIGNFNFYQPDAQGKSNVEKSMDRFLKGKPGVRVMQRNVKGQIDGELRVDAPQQGGNVYLTIDAKIQYIAEQALRAVGRGAAVVVDPNNGNILAMASVPSYDPNVFIPSVSAADWKLINEDDTDPLMNRAINAYAPGSTYKIVTALGGLRKGISDRRFTCSGGVTYGNKFMKCWVLAQHMAPHGSLGLSDAIKHSCNAFFYQYGNAAGIDNIVAVGEALGLGQKSGLNLTGENEGVLPGPKWLNIFNPRERWSNGHTANVSIGQGYVLASPLQMAMVVSAVANGGVCYQPRLVDRVLDQNGNPVRDENGHLAAPPPIIRAKLSDAGVTPEQVDLIRNGMWKVVNEGGGTARRAKIKNAIVAGKTGTAQFWRGNKKDNHTWFICFAPYEQPKYAVCVFVQGAKAGGAVPAPIAARILEESIALEQGFDPQMAWLEPAKGSFAFIQQVDFKSGVPAQYAVDLETADHTDEPDRNLAQERRQTGATPDIQPDADERGRVGSAKASKGRQRSPEAERDRRNIFQRFFGTKKSGGDRKPARPSNR
jgi:penicillin-binding protein 2